MFRHSAESKNVLPPRPGLGPASRTKWKKENGGIKKIKKERILFNSPQFNPT